ncbi:hypothetical protein KC207_11270 [Phycicoccus sp. BSK3Z-2]|uniref:Uncharacterized protein n=1 Tax=Phycicoccus avicenniae TaxID=2828860 RepID=A0A941I0F6_9MICO|nr:hypothetical protein [Phycicoccus avicenniae]MBR7743870.1 hypothetical protein [Phycicoccus avicenniae]
MTRTRRRTAAPTTPTRRRERGDVPGWVLITLMTAGLVAALWVVAEDQLVSLFQQALSSVAP